jgi:hypothetical protein
VKAEQKPATEEGTGGGFPFKKECTLHHTNRSYQIGELHAEAVGHQGPRRKASDVNSLGIRPYARLQRIDELRKKRTSSVKSLKKYAHSFGRRSTRASRRDTQLQTQLDPLAY